MNLTIEVIFLSHPNISIGCSGDKNLTFEVAQKLWMGGRGGDMWPTDPHIFSENVYIFLEMFGIVAMVRRDDASESNKNEDNKRVKINLSFIGDISETGSRSETNKKTFSRARFRSF